MNQNKTKKSSGAVLFYVCSVILLFITLFCAYYSYSYIKNLGIPSSEFGQVWKDIVNVYVSQCTVPFVGAILSYGIGTILSRFSITQDSCMEKFHSMHSHGSCCAEETTCGCEEVKEETTCGCEEVKEETTCDCEEAKEETTCGCEEAKEETTCGCEETKEETTCGCEETKEK